jgi:hypothetical protein
VFSNLTLLFLFGGSLVVLVVMVLRKIPLLNENKFSQKEAWGLRIFFDKFLKKDFFRKIFDKNFLPKILMRLKIILLRLETKIESYLKKIREKKITKKGIGNFDEKFWDHFKKDLKEQKKNDL